MSKRIRLKNNFILIIFLVTIISAAASCGIRDLATGRIEPPQVEFRGLTIYPPQRQGWPLSARLHLTNPNPETLRITGYDYELSVDGADLVRGESKDAITLPASGEGLVEVPIVLNLQAVPSTVKYFLLQDRLRYELSGGFRLASVMGGFLRVPFRFSGEITRKEGLDHLRSFFRPTH
jgi:LEA14-like dessication related protein